MRIIKRTSEDEMVAVFLRCELDSHRFGAGVLQALERAGLCVALIESPDLSNQTENRERREMLGELKGYRRDTSLFRLFPSDVQWSRVILTEQELQRALYIDYDYWIELSRGSRSPGNAARRIRQGIEVFNQPNEVFWSAVKALGRGERFHEMIFVTHDRTRLVVMEGHVRLTAFMLAEDPVPDEIEVILGHSANMIDWPLY